MSLTEEMPARIPNELCTFWEERLLDWSRFRQCRKGPYGLEPLGECEKWDRVYNTSDDSEIDSFRQADQANYAIWVHDFADRLDVEVEQALATLQKAGACMPCIGRALYDFLRHDYIMPFLKPQPLLGSLRGTSDFPGGLYKVKGETELAEKWAHQKFACERLISMVENHCGGHAYYEKLAILLNHGKSCRVRLQGGFFGPIEFSSILTEYTEGLLRQRHRRGNPHHYLQTILRLPLARIWDLVRFMRSRRT